MFEFHVFEGIHVNKHSHVFIRMMNEFEQISHLSIFYENKKIPFTGLGKFSAAIKLFLYFALNFLISFCTLDPTILFSEANK